jgi:hypothetical protein
VELVKMMRRALILLSTGILFHAVVQSPYGASFECAKCHSVLIDVLPSSHSDYKNDSCNSCHTRNGEAQYLEKLIHSVHFDKMPDMAQDCSSCHIVETENTGILDKSPKAALSKSRIYDLKPYFLSWIKSSNLDHVHKNYGVYCSDCHTDYLGPEAGYDTYQNCVACHGDYENLRLSAELSETDPHNPHFPDLKCDSCHKGHTGFENFCAKCHSFSFKWSMESKQ